MKLPAPRMQPRPKNPVPAGCCCLGRNRIEQCPCEGADVRACEGVCVASENDESAVHSYQYGTPEGKPQGLSLLLASGPEGGNPQPGTGPGMRAYAGWDTLPHEGGAGLQAHTSGGGSGTTHLVQTSGGVTGAEQLVQTSSGVVGAEQLVQTTGGGAGARPTRVTPSVEAAVRHLQTAWRAMRAVRQARKGGKIMRDWRGLHAKRHGTLVSHVRYLQWFFRTTRSVCPGCWTKGRLRGAAAVTSALGRKRVETRCQGGENLAGPSEFETQRALAEEMLDWYSTYVALLRRLESGVTPVSIQNFVGGGGSSEGCRRAGGASHGVDMYAQEDYVRRFGSDSFTQADGLSWATIKALRDRTGATFMVGGPPCKFYSRARVRGEATQPPLIDGFRDMCEALFGTNRLWAIENVMGAAKYMSPSATMLDGAYFGLRVARARLYETNFDLIVDRCVREPADALGVRCCLGGRRRFRRFDEFGRPLHQACCAGNIYALQGTAPWRCTARLF